MSRVQANNDWLDSIIESIVVNKNEPDPKWTAFVEADLKKLTMLAREAFLASPMLLRVEPAINICGDIHGQLQDLLRLFETNGYPPQQRYLFMGDLVDRGKYNLEVISLLFAYKLRYPDSVHLLRGNHEDESLTRVYGFMDECKRRYSMGLWKAYVNAFDCMPLAAVVGSKIFCVHGGISPSMRLISEIDEISRPCPVGSSGLKTDLLWADPDPTGSVRAYAPNVERGCSFMFGKEAVNDFLTTNGLDLLCRAHEVAEDGYQFNFDRKVVTVFSAPNYSDAYTNSAAVLRVSESLLLSFSVLKPKSKLQKELASPRKASPKKASPKKASPRKSSPRKSSPRKSLPTKMSPRKPSPRKSSPRCLPTMATTRRISPLPSPRSPIVERKSFMNRRVSPLTRRISLVVRRGAKRSPIVRTSRTKRVSKTSKNRINLLD